ncbi:hypothetical protein [Nocardiopsis metallicus]|uniref:Uncharacterized protein n=1 Tax=Nocardiopsis metallicus TaxID=179819 RepID=A0A840WHD5_9ACTN|nr:hypothetical protein [Nocardiopsis metallicus]MBB5494873.1 hypothetical protein [Nocardiopsis metallicus]
MPAAWRTTPMPEPVQALPRTSTGMPVPFTVSRGHDPERIAYRPETGLTVVCDCEPHSEPPVFGSQCPERQRQCARDRLCSVCGQPIGDQEYSAFGALPMPGTDLYLEPGAHTGCLAYAFRACPVLARECGPDHPVVLAKRVHTYEMRRFYAPDQGMLAIHRHDDQGGHDTPLHLYVSQPLSACVLNRDSFLDRFLPTD